jgi:quercetin dioxygenase-like cupin family protein
VADAIFLGPDDGERLGRPGVSAHRVLAELPEFEAFELSFQPGWEGVDAHSHADHVDSFYVLEGEAEFLVGDRTVRGGPGTYVAVPQGIVHGFRNVGNAALRVVNIHAPKTGFAEGLR